MNFCQKTIKIAQRLFGTEEYNNRMPSIFISPTIEFQLKICMLRNILDIYRNGLLFN